MEGSKVVRFAHILHKRSDGRNANQWRSVRNLIITTNNCIVSSKEMRSAACKTTLKSAVSSELIHKYSNSISRQTRRSLASSTTNPIDAAGSSSSSSSSSNNNNNGSGSIGWVPSKLPNPLTHPSDCGRLNVAKSNVCDPDCILSKDQQDLIEGYLNQLESHCVVAIVSQMNPQFVSNIVNPNATANVNGSAIATPNPTANNGDIKARAAKYFAMTIHDAWGIGDSQSHDGIVIFLSIKDRVIFISTGKGVSEKLNAKVVKALTTNMIPFLRQQRYDSALEYCILEINSLLSNMTTGNDIIQTAEGGANYSRANSQSDSNSNKNQSEDSESFQARKKTLNDIWIPVGILLGIGILWGKDNRKAPVTLEQSRSELNSIYEGDDVSCPYCLRIYNESEAGRTKISLQCGHSYCSRCYSELVQSAVASGEMQPSSNGIDTSAATTCSCVVCNESCVVVGSKAKKEQNKTQEVKDTVVVPTTSDANKDRVEREGSSASSNSSAAYAYDYFSWITRMWQTAKVEEEDHNAQNTPSHTSAAPATASAPTEDPIELARKKSALYRLRKYQERHGHNISEKEIRTLRKAILRGEAKGKAAIATRQKAMQEQINRLEATQERQRQMIRSQGSSGSSDRSSWGSGGKSSGGAGNSW